MTDYNCKNHVSKFVKRIRKYEDVIIGMDVHKNSYAIAAYSIEFGHVAIMTTPADEQATVRLFKKAENSIILVVYEAGVTGFSLYRTLTNAGFTAGVIAPSSIPHKTVKGSKTDSIDCRKLAEYTANNMTSFIAVPELQQDSRRQIVRHRKNASRSRAKIKTQIKMFLIYNGLEEPDGLENWSNASVKKLGEMALDVDLRFTLDELMTDLDVYKKKLSRFDKRLRSMGNQKECRSDFERLMKVPGVGHITALTFLTEMFNPGRFDDRREVTAYMGFAPRIIQSGEKTIHAGLSHVGNRRLRHVLVEAAWRWKIGDVGACKLFNRLVQRSGKSQKAIVAVARKLGIIMWRMCVTGEAYRPIV